MGIGGSKGSGTQTQESPSASALSALAQQFVQETSGIRTGLIDAMQEVLSVGGSTIPIISRTIEASRRASSRALGETEESLAQSGLAGTPAGERIRSAQVQEGEIKAGQAGESLAQSIFGMISNFVLGQSQTAFSGLSGAIPGDVTTRADTKAISGGASK